MRSKKIRNTYEFFCRAEGNQHIASEYAIRKLAELIALFKAKRILEIGLGIGSISGTILDLYKEKSIYYSGTEDNPFCLQALSENLKEVEGNLDLYPNIEAIPKKNSFDLIIIDGKDQHLKMIKKLLTSNGIIVIEGDRLPQQEVLEDLFPSHKLVHAISASKNHSKSPFPSQSWQGGVKIIFADPNTAQTLWWIKEKVKTKIKYFYRGLKKTG